MIINCTEDDIDQDMDDDDEEEEEIDLENEQPSHMHHHQHHAVLWNGYANYATAKLSHTFNMLWPMNMQYTQFAHQI